jgi:tape measure domain-containing protein
MARQIERATTQMNNIEATMRVATGSAQAAGQQISFIRAESERLGLFFPSVAKQMAQFSAAARTTSITSSELKTIFTGISEASRAMGLTAPQAEGAMMALQQMMSKGKVSAEELRQQLGERMPGSIQITADALDVTTPKLFEMMENGRLLSDEVLPEFGRELQRVFGGEAEDQATKIAASIQRLRNSIFDLLAQDNLSGASQAIDQLANSLGSPRFQESFDQLVTVLSNLSKVIVDNLGLLTKLAVAIGSLQIARRVTLGLSGMVGTLASLTGKIVATNTATVSLVGGMTALSAVISRIAWPVAIITSVASAVSLFTDNTKEARSATKDWGDEIERLREGIVALRRQRLESQLLEAEQAASELTRLRDALAEGQRLLNIRDTEGRRERVAEIAEQVKEAENAAEAALLIRTKIEELNRSNQQDKERGGPSFGEDAEEAKKSLQDYQEIADRMGLGDRNERDLLPSIQRGQVDQRERLLELVEGEALTQEELLEKVIKTGTEGERLYSKWESALRDVGSVIKDDISDGLTDVIMQAESAKDVFEGLLNTIARTITQQQIVDPFVNQVSSSIPNMIGGGAGGTSVGGGAPPNVRGVGPQSGGGGLFSGIGDFFDGFFANGGNVSGGQAHVVGERGPEMFVPRQDGQIVPNHQMGGGGGDVTVNIINQSGEQLQSEQQNKRRGPNGEMTVDVMVKSSMERLDSQGQLDGIFRRHGAKRQGQF